MVLMSKAVGASARNQLHDKRKQLMFRNLVRYASVCVCRNRQTQSGPSLASCCTRVGGAGFYPGTHERALSRRTILTIIL